MTAEKGANRNEKIDNRKKNCTCIKIKKIKKKEKYRKDGKKINKIQIYTS